MTSGEMGDAGTPEPTTEPTLPASTRTPSKMTAPSNLTPGPISAPRPTTVPPISTAPGDTAAPSCTNCSPRWPCRAGDGAHIGARCELLRGARVWPGVFLPDGGIRYSSDV